MEDKDVVINWSEELKYNFIKEGSRRIFYNSFAFYYSRDSHGANLVVKDFRTGHMNNNYYIGIVNLDNGVSEDNIIRILDCAIRKVSRDTKSSTPVA